MSCVETVTTWADGFGRWHARVRFDAPGYGLDAMAAHAVRVRARARRAIRREVAVRGEAGPGWRCRVEVVGNDLDSFNVVRSLTFVERMQ